jgi:chemotaxis protein CheD
MALETLALEKSLVANLGEIKISRDPEVTISCLGVGSCIALCMYDPGTCVGGVAHIVLPFSTNGTQSKENATKYADVAIPELLKRMREQGAVRSRLIVKIAGGAQMFSPGASAKGFDTGARNIEAVKKVLADEALRIDAEDIGGNRGRTVRLYIATGKVVVRIVGGITKEL